MIRNVATFLLLFPFVAVAQTAPIWTYHFTKCTPIDESVSPDGSAFSIWARTDTIASHCSSLCTYSLLLNPGGTLTWENYYDTTNGCRNDDPAHCSIITGQAFASYAISSRLHSPYDCFHAENYDAGGSLIYDDSVGNWNGGIEGEIGNMNDSNGYVLDEIPFQLSKISPIGNLYRIYTGPDSCGPTASYFGRLSKRILLAAEDYTISVSDQQLRVIGIDTMGNELFNFTSNIFTGSNELPKKVWFTPNRKVVGVEQSSPSTFGNFVFSFDTLGNLSWAPVFINFFRDAVYDPLNNVIHVLGNGSGNIKMCYRIDCSTGILTDSMSIDSVMGVTPKLALDTLGNLYVGYQKVPSTVPTFTAERYTTNYWLDWIGQATEPVAATWGFGDIRITDSAMVYLFYWTTNNSTICKFDPPAPTAIADHYFGTGLNLFPNPANSYFTIQTANRISDAKILISDVSGRLHRVVSLSKNQTTIDISTEDLQPGMYFVQCIGDGVLIETKKIVIQH